MVGAVVPIVNVPGVSRDISFTPEALAGIFLGKITKWNDPILKRANRGLNLPDLDIAVVHRADGSGTSYAWTDYLSKTSPEWKAEVGASLSPKWPAGRGATGNDGVAKACQRARWVHRLRGVHLRSAEPPQLRKNSESKRRICGGQSGKHRGRCWALRPHSGRLQERPSWMHLIQAPIRLQRSPGSLFPVTSPDDAKRSAMQAFLKWMLGPGQRQAAALGYLALPREIVTKEEDAIARIH